VRELPNHLPPGAVLYQQRIFAADLVASRHVGHLDDQRSACDFDWRDAAIDDTFIRVHLGRAQAQLVGVIVTRLQHAPENVAHLGLVVDQPQQGLAARALQADAEDVLGRGIEIDDQQAVVDKNDARAKAVENSLWIVCRRAAVAGMLRVA
jgi:hypothetical protein